MACLLISSDAFCGGEAVAAEAASLLGYALIGAEVFQEAGERYGVSAETISRAATQAPALIGMSMDTRKRCLAYLRATLAGHLVADEKVYHGPVGHFLIEGISHVVRVRLTADLEYRVTRASEAESLPESKARKLLEGADKQLRKLAQTVFHVDALDAELFDQTVDVGRLGLPAAAAAIAETARERRFQPTTYSRGRMQELVLVARVRARLVQQDPDVQVRAEGGEVQIRIKEGGGMGHHHHSPEDIEREVRKVEGVTGVGLEIVRDVYKNWPREM